MSNLFNNYDEYGNLIVKEIDDNEQNNELKTSEIKENDEMNDSSSSNQSDSDSSVEILYQEHDTQDIDQAIISTKKKLTFFHEYDKNLELYTKNHDFMLHLMKNPKYIRTISIVGDFKHGKTSLLDLLRQYSYKLNILTDINLFTDHRMDEQQRTMSIEASPFTLSLVNAQNKSYLFHLMDTPGHLNFIAQQITSLKISDGVLLVVDVTQYGKSLYLQKTIQQLILKKKTL